MEVDALYSLMEGEEVVLEVKIANPRKLGGALAAGNALGALFRGMIKKGRNKNLALESVFVITNKRVIVASCSSNSGCCCGKESRKRTDTRMPIFFYPQLRKMEKWV